MGNLVMGTCIAWSGSALPGLKLPAAQDGFEVTESEGSWIGSLLPLGALLGAPLGGYLSSRFGKKGAMFLDAGFFSLGYLVLAVAPATWILYIGRLVCGIATGVSCTTCPIYVAEISTPNYRGLLGSGMQVMVVLGVLLSISVGAVLSWRWMSIVCLAAVLLWSVLLFLVPETPAQHITDKKYREARESLEWLRETIYVEAEYEEIQQSVEDGISRSGGIQDLFKTENLAPLIISLVLMFGQQMSGMNAVLFYVVDIFTAAGSSIPPSIESIIVALVQVVATVLGAIFMDKLGRRFLLIFSSLVMVISISSVGAYFYIKDNLGDTDLATKLQILPVASLSIFVFAFSVGFGPIPWLMTSEIFSPEVRGPASSIATAFNWALAFIVTKFFSNLVAAISEAFSFWVFGALTALVLVFCILFVPETKGKSLDSIQSMFRSGSPYFLEIGMWKLCRRRSRTDQVLLVEEEEY